MSEYVSIAEFVEFDEPGAEPLAASGDGGSVIPAAGLVVFYGNGGAGKTTALVDAAMHLAAGAPWLGGLVTPARPLTLVWIENEGPRPEFRKKLRVKREAWEGGSVDRRFHIHEHPWGQFSFVRDDDRAGLVQRIHDLTGGDETVDLVIAGPVKTIGMRGAGTDDDIGEFLGYVEEVQRQTGVTVVLVHHENRAGQISGAWESRPDTLVHVQAQGHGRTRLFWQKCRWSSELHGTSTSLLWAPGYGFDVDQREEITEEAQRAGILAAVDFLPGGSWSKLRDLTDDSGARIAKGRSRDLERVRDQLLAEGLLVNTAARDGHFKLWRPEDPAAGRSHAGTGWERLPFLAQEGASDPSRSPVPSSIGNGDGNGTGYDPEPIEIVGLS